MVLVSLIFWSLRGNSGFTFSTLHSGSLQRFPLIDTSDIYLASVGSVSCGKKFYSPFLLSFTPELHGQSYQVLLLTGVGTCLITLMLAFCFGWLPSLPKLGSSVTCAVDQAGLKIRDPQASAFCVLGLEVCTTTP